MTAVSVSSSLARGCLLAASSLTPSATIPPASLVIVDCGSGYSRAARFHRCPDTRFVRARSTGSNIAALHHVLHCPDASAAWLERLVGLVEEVDADATEVWLGATGGVRERVSSGAVTADAVARFRASLATLPFRARLLLLDGEDEARYEFAAAAYCAGRCGHDAPRLGLLSSGGMSSQLCVSGDSGDSDTSQCRCLPTNIKRGNGLGLEHGMEEGTALFRRQAEEVVATHVPANFGGEDVLYVAIEMFAAVGEKAGLGAKTVGAVPVADAIDGLSTFLARTAAEDRALGEEGVRTWKTYVHAMSGIVAISMLQRLHPGSKVLFVREFELEEDNIVKPSWSLGRAIETLCQEEVTLCAA